MRSPCAYLAALLDDAGDDVADLAGELAELLLVLRLAQALHDQLASDGGGEAAEVLRRVVELLREPRGRRRGGRLGYGGGFYDRTLEQLRAKGPVMAIGFAYGAQEAEALPLEPTDQPLDLIVTERRVIEFT